MILETFLRKLNLADKNGSTVITSVTENIDDVKSGSLFAAIKGKNHNGNDFISEALQKGAAAVITDEKIQGGRIYSVGDVRSVFGEACSEFYCRPQDKLVITGITGTNGKTTTAEYLRHILSVSGVKTAVIGTLGSRRDGYSNETGFTTPSAAALFAEMDSHVKAGVTHLVMEVSSQALSQQRTYPTEFEIAVLTNTGHDHLDYHKTFEEYINAKKQLFGMSRNALINADDPYACDFSEVCGSLCRTYSAKDRLSDFSAKNIRFNDDCISYLFLTPSGLVRIKSSGTGYIKVYNTLCAVSAASMLGVNNRDIEKASACFPDIKGRMQCIKKDGIEVYIDFAHTPEALSSVLNELRGITQGKLICVFGCGGNRDKSKRSEMGNAASFYSDEIILTSDNPRDEDAVSIINDIKKGISGSKKLFIYPDRAEAIETAVNSAASGDTILIAGKGHEEYQITCGEKTFFSDELTVKKIFGI